MDLRAGGHYEMQIRLRLLQIKKLSICTQYKMNLEMSGSVQRWVLSCGSEDGVAKPAEAAAALP